MPSFEVLDQDGNTVRSEDFIGRGRKTIIYFYPKDNTSGCTAEACSFRDNYAALTAAGYNVVGVSKDSVKSHTGFRARHGLPFRLLADTSTEMLQAFGAWGEKKMYGKTVLGTLRRTFVFSEDGVLEKVIEKVDGPHFSLGPGTVIGLWDVLASQVPAHFADPGHNSRGPGTQLLLTGDGWGVRACNSLVVRQLAVGKIALAERGKTLTFAVRVSGAGRPVARYERIQ